MSGKFMATCGNCYWWRYVPESGPAITIGAGKRGNCYGVPPTPYAGKVDNTGRVITQGNMRPALPETEPACSLFFDADTAKKMTAEMKN